MKVNKLQEGYDSVIKDLESIELFLRRENFDSYDVIDYNEFPMGTSVISFEVEGDWKHEHLLFEDLVYEWAEENDRDIFKIDSETVEETGSDWYTARYKVFITKDHDTTDKLNSMRRLFEAKDSYFTKSMEATVKDLANGRFDNVDEFLNENLNDKKVKLTYERSRYGGFCTNTYEPPVLTDLNKYIEQFDSVEGNENSKYCLILLSSNISYSYYDKIIFSDSLQEVKKEAKDWLDGVTSPHSDEMILEYHYYAMIVDLESMTEISRGDTWQPREDGKKQKGWISLDESLIDPTEEDIKAFEEIIAYNDFDIEKKGKTLFGNIHYQIIDRQEAEINSQEALKERIENFIQDVDNFEEEYNIPVTWNFGVNDEDILTAGIDLREKFVDDEEALWLTTDELNAGQWYESLDEELSNIEAKCRDKFKELETILLSGQNADVENNIKKAFEAVNGKVWFKEKSPRYLMFDGKVGNYTLRNSVHIEYLKGDLIRLAEDLVMAYNVLLGGEREYTPNFIKRILNSTNVSESKNSLKESNDELSYEALSALRNFKKHAQNGDELKIDINGNKGEVSKEADGWYLYYGGLVTQGSYKIIEAAVKDAVMRAEAKKSMQEALDNGNDPHKNIDLGYIKGTHWSASIYDKTGNIYLHQHHPYDDAEYCWAYSTDKGKTFIIIKDRKRLETFKADPKEKYQDIIARMGYLDKNTKSRMLYNSLDVRSYCNSREKNYKMTNKKSLNESKNWVLFFDKDGKNRGGSEGAAAFNLIPRNIEKRIKSGDYYLPKWVKSYIIVSDYQFNKLDWRELEEYNKNYGKPINESLTESTDIIYRVVEVDSGKPIRGGSDFTSKRYAQEAINNAKRASLVWPEDVYFPENGYKIIEVENTQESYKMTSKEIVEALNKLDNKAINEDTTFYDLKNLYEANELKAEDRRRLADAIRNGDDPVLIATFLSSKLKDDVDEDFIDTDSLDDDKQLLNEYTIDEDFDEDLGFLDDYLDDYEIPDVISETEIVETEMPSQGEDIGLSDMILDSIQSSAEKIREYNSLSANLGEHEEDLKDVLEDISVNENETLGKLQSMLKAVSPNAENIMNGAVEAEEQMGVEE